MRISDPKFEELTASTPAGMALERCLVEYFALQVKHAGGLLTVSRYDTIKRFAKSMPTMLSDRFSSKYGGSLLRFFTAHASSFVFHGEDGVALQPGFEATSVLAQPDNLKVVQFFLDLLQKIGAVKEQPCFIHTLSKYLPHMDRDARCFLRDCYADSLNVFFTLNGANFGMTSPERGSVFLRRYLAVSNCVAAHLRRCLHERSAFACSTGLAPEEVLLRATRTWLPEVRAYFGDHPGADKLGAVLDSHPNIFKWQRSGKVSLRKQYRAWSDKWDGTEELLATIYFTEMLKDIGATSSNPMCFNYMLGTVEAAPQECSTYLKHVFAGIDLIDLFHLHPDKFDLSTVNCVSLRCKSKDLEQKKPPEVLSAHYTARLLKYAPNMTPDLLRICVENAPVSVKSFCTATVRHRLHTVLDAARALLATGAVDGALAVESLTALCRSFGAKKGSQGQKQSASWTGPNLLAQLASKNTPGRAAQEPGHTGSTKKLKASAEENASIKTLQEPPAPTTARMEEQQHTTHSKVTTPTTLNLQSSPVASSWALPDTAQARTRVTLPELDRATIFGKLRRSHSLDSVSSSDFQPSKAGKCGRGNPPSSEKESETCNGITRTRSPVFSTENEKTKPANAWPAGNAAATQEAPEAGGDASRLEASLRSLLSIDRGRPAGQGSRRASPGGAVQCGVAHNHVYGRMEYALSRFIAQLLKASPAQSEDAVRVVEAVNKAFGQLPSCEVYLALMSSEDTLKFDGRRIFYSPKGP